MKLHDNVRSARQAMSDELQPAIAALERKLSALEQQANGIRSAINVLCETGGMPPRYPDGGEPSGGPTKSDASLTQIGPDTFYGKKQSTAARQFLEMRKGAGAGPATPREIYDGLSKGGYQFETKSDSIALVGLRALLRKNTTTFHRLPNGTYGLAVWYPNARKHKAQADGAPAKDDDDESEEVVVDPNEAANAAA